MQDVFGLTFGAFLIRFGVALLFAGAARAKFVASALVRVLVDFSIAVGAAYVVHRFVPGGRLETAILTGTLATGLAVSTLGERATIGVSIKLSALIGVAVAGLCLVTAHIPDPALWRTLLAGIIAAAAGGLVAAKLIGPRDGRYHRDGSSSVFPSHSLPLQVTGAMLLVGGGLMVQGTVEGLIIPAIAVGVAALVAMWRYGKIDPSMLVIAAVAGLPMMLPPMPAGSRADAFLLAGIAAGVFGPLVFLWAETRWRVDDAAGLAAPVLGAAVGWYLACDVIHLVTPQGTPTYLMIGAAVLVGALALGVVSAVIAVKTTARPIASEADLFDGLDLAEHDVNAYPDFQQTMIKSFHLREK
jgi:hypothetical protein